METLILQAAIKILLVLELGTVSELEVVDIFKTFNGNHFHEFALFANIEGKRDRQLLTCNAFQNDSIKTHEGATSLNQIYYDKGINQQNFNIVMRNSTTMSLVGKYDKIFCQFINATCIIKVLCKELCSLVFNSYGNPCLFFEQCSGFPPDVSYDFSYPFEFQRFCILLPKGSAISNLWAMVHAFEYKLLIGFSIFFIFSGIYWYYIVKGTSSEKKLLDIYFCLFGMLITNGTHLRLENRIERIFCLSFIILSFYMIFGYTCKMTSLLVVPQYEKELATMKETEIMKKIIIFTGELSVFFFHSVLNGKIKIVPNRMTASYYAKEYNGTQDHYGIYLTSTDIYIIWFPYYVSTKHF